MSTLSRNRTVTDFLKMARARFTREVRVGKRAQPPGWTKSRRDPHTSALQEHLGPDACPDIYVSTSDRPVSEADWTLVFSETQAHFFCMTDEAAVTFHLIMSAP